jgi:hypothetical protein
MNEPRHTRVQIEVTINLPRRLGWLLAGIAIGITGLPDGLFQLAVRALGALLLK